MNISGATMIESVEKAISENQEQFSQVIKANLQW